MARPSYNHKDIEVAAQTLWEEQGLYTTNLSDDSKEKYYLLFEFPYPSGDLHIGHWYAFALTDIYARKLRMAGKNVLFPVGFDAFGLPAENAAIKNGVNPKEWTYANMDTMRAQMRTMGTSVDWSKEIISCDPAYYKWTQWLFTKFMEHNLAERKNALVKWCPKDQTVLANEQVNDGHCERCGSEVEDKNLTQWFLKITTYADRLLKDLDGLPWREDIKDAQRAWIGESEGAKLTFTAHTGEGTFPHPIEVFTTRPDTVFGATYVVLAPEHPLIDVLIQDALNADAIRAYQKETGKKTERERSENKDKTGVLLEGITATNPATKLEVPIYIADYVLASYGTGAVMAVPAHDERDSAFAATFNLPILPVVARKMIDVLNPPVPDAPTARRDGVLAILRNPENNTYLVLSWKKEGWTTFVTGGIDENETAVEAGLREIAEETGYTDVQFVRQLGAPTEVSFHAIHKGVNRVALNTALLFDLVSTKQEVVAAEELDRHTSSWKTLDEVRTLEMRHAEIDILLSELTGTTDPYTGDGILINSGDFTGRDSREAMWDIVAFAQGERVTNYRLRDWSVGRQRYWGCPIPVVYDPDGVSKAIPAEHLPWLLPEDVDMTPGSAGAGMSPLASSTELRERVTRIFGEGWTPEYDTLDTFVDSSWYFFRYLDAHNEHAFSDPALIKKWMAVDRYSGGSEHTTMHLLYARFFTKVMYDLALSPVSEPFIERFNRGIILGPDGAKMSKSKGNVINPDEVVTKFGADAVRMYLAFIGPYNEPGHYPWNLDGSFAMRKFLDRIYALLEKRNESTPDEATLRALAQASAKVGAEIDRFKFNTAISGLMILVRDLEALKEVPTSTLMTLTMLLAPFAPHLAEHMWKECGGTGSVHTQQWPEVDPSLLLEDTDTVIVQINGKKRAEMTLPKGASEEEALLAARSMAGVESAINGGAPKRVIYVPGRILNIVI